MRPGGVAGGWSRRISPPFFEATSHDRLMAAIEARISDRHLLKTLRAMLRAGVMKEGTVRRSVTGTPQGGVISARAPAVTKRFGMPQHEPSWRWRRWDGSFIAHVGPRPFDYYATGLRVCSQGLGATQAKDRGQRTPAISRAADGLRPTRRRPAPAVS